MHVWQYCLLFENLQMLVILGLTIASFPQFTKQIITSTNAVSRFEITKETEPKREKTTTLPGIQLWDDLPWHFPSCACF